VNAFVLVHARGVDPSRPIDQVVLPWQQPRTEARWWRALLRAAAQADLELRAYAASFLNELEELDADLRALWPEAEAQSGEGERVLETRARVGNAKRAINADLDNFLPRHERANAESSCIARRRFAAEG
jgi:hypothetical protein